MAGGNLRRQNLAKQMSTAVQIQDSIDERKKSNIKKWASYYRRNWEIFVEDVLQIRLYPIQKVIIHLMGISDEFFCIATRGAAKSFLCAIGTMCEFCLKSYSEIVIVSSTISQASKMVENKIRDEIIKKLSPYLQYMYEHEYIVITKSNTDAGAYTVENKLNGSKITVLPLLDSARGSRSTFNVLEETRLLKKSLVDSIVRPMLHSRPVPYLTKKEYQTRRWLEKGRTVNITSARYTYEWFARAFKDTVKEYYLSKNDKYVPFAEDIFAAIADGSRTWADYRKSKKMMGETDFRCEILNEMLGENEDSFFSLQSFVEHQTLRDCFRMPSAVDLIVNGIDYYKLPKEEKEIRIIASDFSWTATKGNGNESDNSIAICISGKWKNGVFIKNVDYIDVLPTADDADGCAMALKRLYWIYDADYIVPDCRSTGEAVLNALSKNDIDEIYGVSIPARGLGVSDDSAYHVVSVDKLAYYREKAIDKNYIPCVIPIIGTSALNTAYWRATKIALERGYLNFLISMQEYKTMLEDSGEFYKMTSEQFANDVNPYAQTEALIAEAISLKAEVKQDQIKLEAPRNGHRDRIVTLAMGILIFSYIENEWLKQEQQDDYDFDDIQLVY